MSTIALPCVADGSHSVVCLFVVVFPSTLNTVHFWPTLLVNVLLLRKQIDMQFILQLPTYHFSDSRNLSLYFT